VHFLLCFFLFQLNGLNSFFWANGVCLSCFRTTRTVAASKIPWDIGMRQEQNWRDLAAQGCCGPNQVGRIAVIWTQRICQLEKYMEFWQILVGLFAVRVLVLTCPDDFPWLRKHITYKITVENCWTSIAFQVFPDLPWHLRLQVPRREVIPAFTMLDLRIEESQVRGTQWK